MSPEGEILAALKHGLAAKDAAAVESAIPRMFHHGVTREYLEVLNGLALEPWHKRHEDVVSALEAIRDPSSVPVLAQTLKARHPYLEYDKAYALATKSIYALAKIQTPDALAILADLVVNAAPGHRGLVLRSAAKGRLENLAAKGKEESIRAEARHALQEAGTRPGRYAPDAEKRNILALMEYDSSEDEFLEAAGLRREDVDGHIARMLDGALRDKDPIAAEFALYLALYFGVSDSYVPQLRELARADWHRLHEDVAMALAESER